jgi:hypothetical protein
VLRYAVAFMAYSTQFFWDAANDPPGSPFSPQEGLFTQIGCANGFSVADVAGRLLWIAQAKEQKGRTIYMMVGTEQQKVSTPDVERILNADDLADVRAYGISLDGHPCYVLTLVTSNITLGLRSRVADVGQWSSLTIGHPSPSPASRGQERRQRLRSVRPTA